MPCLAFLKRFKYATLRSSRPQEGPAWQRFVMWPCLPATWIAPVSAVVDRTAPVGSELHERIRRVVNELGYMSHATAANLRSGRSRMIGLVMPDINNPHFVSSARTIEHGRNEADFVLTLRGTSGDDENELKQLQKLRRRRSTASRLFPAVSQPNDPHRLREAVSTRRVAGYCITPAGQGIAVASG